MNDPISGNLILVAENLLTEYRRKLNYFLHHHPEVSGKCYEAAPNRRLAVRVETSDLPLIRAEQKTSNEFEAVYIALLEVAKTDRECNAAMHAWHKIPPGEYRKANLIITIVDPNRPVTSQGLSPTDMRFLKSLRISGDGLTEPTNPT